jgi:hypothetical protein
MFSIHFVTFLVSKSTIQITDINGARGGLLFFATFYKVRSLIRLNATVTARLPAGTA